MLSVLRDTNNEYMNMNMKAWHGIENILKFTAVVCSSMFALLLLEVKNIPDMLKIH